MAQQGKLKQPREFDHYQQKAESTSVDSCNQAKRLQARASDRIQWSWRVPELQ